MAAIAVVPRRRWIAKAFFGLVGVAAVAALVSSVGGDRVLDRFEAGARWLPLLLVIEGLRIGTELGATERLAAAFGAKVPAGPMVRIHVACNAMCQGLPAGRVVCETAKARWLRPWLDTARAAALGTTHQACHLLAAGLISIPCAVAAMALDAHWLAVAIALHGVVSLVGGAALLLAGRGRRLTGWLGRIRRIGEHAPRFGEAMRELPTVPWEAAGVLLAGRALQIVQIAIVARAVGLPSSLPSVFGWYGLQLVAVATADFLPGQLGATDGAFALGVSHLGGTVAAALAAAVLIHWVQLLWVAAGAATVALGFSSPRGDPAAGESATRGNARARRIPWRGTGWGLPGLHRAARSRRA